MKEYLCAVGAKALQRQYLLKDPLWLKSHCETEGGQACTLFALLFHLQSAVLHIRLWLNPNLHHLATKKNRTIQIYFTSFPFCLTKNNSLCASFLPRPFFLVSLTAASLSWTKCCSCVWVCACPSCSVCRERAAGASAVVSSDSSTAYGRALWRMGAVTRQSAYPPMGEANRANTMRKRRKQLNISTPLIYSPTLGEVYWRSLEERAFKTLAMAKVTKYYYTVNHIKDSYSAGVKVIKSRKRKRKDNTLNHLPGNTCKCWGSHMNSLPLYESHKGA